MRSSEPGIRRRAGQHCPTLSIALLRRPALFLAVLFSASCNATDIRSEDILMHPDDSAFRTQAPDSFRVRFTTSEGEFVVAVDRDWAPRGADRFYNLVRAGYYDGNHFFRVIPEFMAQFGIHGDPHINDRWTDAFIDDDAVTHLNERGTVVFAHGGPDTRATQVFINFRHNEQLDSTFAPFGRVVEGLDVVDALYGGYGELAPYGAGPHPQGLAAQGNAYLDRVFPLLDSIVRADVVTR